MNSKALGTVLADSLLWKKSAEKFLALFDMSELTPLQRLTAISYCYAFLPFVYEVEKGGAISSNIANLYKFYRGIAAYCRHRLVAEALGTETGGASMFEYVEAMELFVSTTGVCPAPRKFVDRVEIALTQLSGKRNLVNGRVHGLSTKILTSARSLNVCFELFGILCALVFIVLSRQIDVVNCDSRFHALAKFPLPYVGRLKEHINADLPLEYFAGLKRVAEAMTLPHLETLNIAVVSSVLAVEHANTSPEFVDECIDIAWALNLEVCNTLGVSDRGLRPNFCSVLRDLFHAKLVA
nr:hypothetical protein [uncultured Roseateles sp.]